MTNAPRRRLDNDAPDDTLITPAVATARRALGNDLAGDSRPTPALATARRALEAEPTFFSGLIDSVSRGLTPSPALGRRVVRIVVPTVAALALAGTVAGGSVLRPDGVSAEPAAMSPAVIDTPRLAQAESSPSPSSSANPGPTALPRGESIAPVQVEATAVVPEATGELYANATVNIRAESSTDSESVGSLDEGEKVSVTDRTEDEWQQVVVGDRARWVNSQFLSEDPPAPEDSGSSANSGSSSSGSSSSGSSSSAAAGGSSSGGSAGTGGTCTRNLGSKSGLSSAASSTWDAVCANFPEVSTIGGLRNDPGSNHHSGRAIDIMTSGDRGWEIANWARSNASSLGLTEVIYAQQIWTTQRSGEGWRPMSDRGSATANHFDHVHLSTN